MALMGVAMGEQGGEPWRGEQGGEQWELLYLSYVSMAVIGWLDMGQFGILPSPGSLQSTI